MLKAFHYCNNCGKTGHAFHQCKYPITSIGVIVYRKGKATAAAAAASDDVGSGSDDNIKYLMISRKDSLGFVEFIRGKYQLYNEIYLRNIIDGMTNDEKKQLLTDDFNGLLQSLWGVNANITYKSEELISREKYNKLKEGIKIEDTTYSLKTLVEQSTTSWETSEWGFPKGRRNYQEKELVCALREFQEETGYKKNLIKIIQNLLPLEEIFTGSNFKSYKHCYYIGCMETFEEPSEPFQESEVGQMGWFSYKEALKLIRPYNIEKSDILTKVHKIVTTYNII
jgi:8-oxo-dGTP pyrophosphatase MutT (NUDIX family)